MEEEKRLDQNKISDFAEDNDMKSLPRAEITENNEPANIDSTVDLVMKQYDDVIKDLVDL